MNSSSSVSRPGTLKRGREFAAGQDVGEPAQREAVRRKSQRDVGTEGERHDDDDRQCKEQQDREDVRLQNALAGEKMCRVHAGP
jgi:hypothetical protein